MWYVFTIWGFAERTNAALRKATCAFRTNLPDRAYRRHGHKAKTAHLRVSVLRGISPRGGADAERGACGGGAGCGRREGRCGGAGAQRVRRCGRAVRGCGRCRQHERPRGAERGRVAEASGGVRGGDAETCGGDRAEGGVGESEKTKRQETARTAGSVKRRMAEVILGAGNTRPRFAHREPKEGFRGSGVPGSDKIERLGSAVFHVKQLSQCSAISEQMFHVKHVQEGIRKRQKRGGSARPKRSRKPSRTYPAHARTSRQNANRAPAQAARHPDTSRAPAASGMPKPPQATRPRNLHAASRKPRAAPTHAAP